MILDLARYVSRDIVEEVLAKTGKKERRTRLLPAHVVVHFVIAVAMVIFHEGYGELVRKLVNGLPLLGGWSQSWSVRTTGRSRRPAIGWMSSRRKAESPL